MTQIAETGGKNELTANKVFVQQSKGKQKLKLLRYFL